MPRHARIVVPGSPHHATQRGNQRRQIFLSDEDDLVYLTWLGETARRFGVRLQDYGLMPNHVYLMLLILSCRMLPSGSARLMSRWSALNR